MPQKSPKKNLQRFIIIASSLALVGSSLILLVEALLNDNQQSSNQTDISTAAVEQLKAQASGYEKVLEREPDNSAALQNLAKIRLQLQDYRGAIAPLEKLVALYPNDAQLPQLLAVVKQQAEAQKTEEKTTKDKTTKDETKNDKLPADSQPKSGN